MAVSTLETPTITSIDYAGYINTYMDKWLILPNTVEIMKSGPESDNTSIAPPKSPSTKKTINVSEPLFAGDIPHLNKLIPVDPKDLDVRNKASELVIDGNIDITPRFVKEILDLPASLVLLLIYQMGGSNSTKSNVSYSLFNNWYNKSYSNLSLERRVFNILDQDSKGYLLPSDINRLVKTILRLNPSLSFLSNSQEFQVKYADTVAIRTFYELDLNNTGRISYHNFRISNFSKTLSDIDYYGDINSVLNYFSYEHFYVIYCSFYILDVHHNGRLTSNELKKYSGYSLNPRCIDRIFKLYSKNNTLLYEDFVKFLLAEECPDTIGSKYYWFRFFDEADCGVIDFATLRKYWIEQSARLNSFGQIAPNFDVIISQVIDMMGSCNRSYFVLEDFINAKMMANFVNIFLNIKKFTQFECRDPYTIVYNNESLEKNSWDRFCRAEYDRLNR